MRPFSVAAEKRSTIYFGTFHTGSMNTPAHVSGLSGPSGPRAAQPVELEQSRGPGKLKLLQSMTAQTALGTVLRPAPATPTHAVRALMNVTGLIIFFQVKYSNITQ